MKQTLVLTLIAIAILVIPMRYFHFSSIEAEVEQKRLDSLELVRQFNVRMTQAVIRKRIINAFTSRYVATQNGRTIIGADTKSALVDSVILLDSKPRYVSINKDTTEMVSDYYGKRQVVYKLFKQ